MKALCKIGLLFPNSTLLGEDSFWILPPGLCCIIDQIKKWRWKCLDCLTRQMKFQNISLKSAASTDYHICLLISTDSDKWYVIDHNFHVFPDNVFSECYYLLVILLLFPSFFSYVLLWMLCAGFLFIIHHWKDTI